ncbi:T9SS type A sorting domain-containing protein [Aquimarina sp. M1]
MKSYFLKLKFGLTLFIGILAQTTFGQCTVGQPNISVQAEAFSNITIVEGTATTLTSPVSGTTYQWTLDGVNISGATDATLTLSNFDTTQVGDYNVIVDSVPLLNSVTLGIFSNSISDYDRDRQALIDFYNSTNGPSWTDNTNWLTGPLETWNGVKVENCRVTELRLSGNNITGAIPASFQNLTELKRLSIRNNNISGVLNITVMSSLLDLYASNNGLSDIRFGSNNLLQRVHIQDNPFTPGKTIDISSMRQLTDFRAARLNLSGLTASGDYNSLLYFIIADNQISGTLDISSMPNLILCYAYDNQFTDFNLGIGSQLERFYFYNNPVTSGKTMDISGMRNLLDFRVQELGLSGLTISGDYDKMLYFIIRDNQIEGTLDISRMPNLRLMYAHNNQYTDFTFGSHPELSRLYLYNNPIILGKTMDISSMRKLLDFRVQGLGLNQLTMSGTYDEMLYFIIKDNQISGALDISMMPKIVLCNAENNFFDSLLLPSNVTGLGRTLSHLFVRYNNLHFDDFLPYSGILGAFNFKYNPQRNVIPQVVGSTISVNVGGGIDYIWSPSGTTGSSYTVTNSGTYSCEVSNAAITNLVIKSDPVFVSATRISNNNSSLNKEELTINRKTYPNPIQRNESIYTDIVLDDNTSIRFVLYTVNGKKIKEFIYKGKHGLNTFQLNSEGLSAGHYILTSEVGVNKVSSMIIIQ